MTDQPLPEGMGLAVLVEKLLKERDLANKQLAALRWQVEHEGCAASHLGETTYECRADAPCGLCRLRAERDRLREAVKLGMHYLKGRYPIPVKEAEVLAKMQAALDRMPRDERAGLTT